MTGRAVRAELPDNSEREILGGDAFGQRAVHVYKHRARLILRQALRRQHLLNLAGANAKRQRAECSMSTRVAIAANNSHPRLRQPEFRANDVHDSLIG